MLCLLGHGENSIHAIHGELSKKYPELQLPTVIADVRDDARIRHVFETFRPNLVYHAAAHKHVPLMEDNIVDAVTNNVLGTITLLRNARLCGVENMTLISTDKAVQPYSVMGVTKRMAELALQICARENGTNFAAVRFGNVLGSRGSVVPIFTAQIAAGGPVTITHPEMRRYFMTIPEAVQLVLQASTLKGNGQIFVLDMGEPVRVLDLALDLIELSGLKPYKDINIVFSGLRPGEKLTESLFREGEVFSRSQHEKIFVIADPSLTGTNGHHLPLYTDGVPDGHGLTTLEEYDRFVRDVVLGDVTFDQDSIIAGIHRLVPEFTTNSAAHANGNDEEHVESLKAS
jgi:FlaA1/EpsC-like NDP-sugar epimerase